MSQRIDWSQYIEQTTQWFEQQREQATHYHPDILTERMIVRPNNRHYPLINDLSYRANTIFNVITYHYRQSILHHKQVNYDKMGHLPQRLHRQSKHRMPTLGYVQGIERKVRNRFINFTQRNQEYQQNPEDFTKRPRIPSYRKKRQRDTFIIGNEDIEVKGRQVIIHGLNNLTVKLRQDIGEIHHIRVVPKDDAFFIEVLYHAEHVQDYLADNQRYLSIDPGLENAFTLTTNVAHLRPVIINGRPLKSYNHQWNRRIHQIQAKHRQYKQPLMSKEIRRLQRSRYLKIERFAHASSHYIVRYAQEHGLHTIIIGENKSRQNLNYQSQDIKDDFVEIPYQTFVQKIIYKGARAGIPVLVVNESYTSQTSFLDHERPIWDNGDTARRKNHLVPIHRRIHRGLFQSNQYRSINADVNGSLQILRKVVPNAFADGILGIGLSPVKHNVNF